MPLHSPPPHSHTVNGAINLKKYQKLPKYVDTSEKYLGIELLRCPEYDIKKQKKAKVSLTHWTCKHMLKVITQQNPKIFQK
jgi:hypothetical protein